MLKYGGLGMDQLFSVVWLAEIVPHSGERDL